MSETIVAAPGNPYRREEMTDESWGSLGMVGGHFESPVSRAKSGAPGMLGSDMDAMCRQHYGMGVLAAEQKAAAELNEMRRELTTAYDRGYTEGRVERARGLARDVRIRLVGAMQEITAVTKGPKTRIPAALSDIQKHLGEEVLDFVKAIEESESKAVGQIQRDEG